MKLIRITNRIHKIIELLLTISKKHTANLQQTNVNKIDFQKP